MNYKKITILGGGPAGLAVGYYAQKRGVPLTIYEASERVGGNCTTYKREDFYYDSGAHRFHDKIPQVTEEIKLLMGDQLKMIYVPSQIYFKGKFIDFPLSPLDLFKKLGPFDFFYAGLKMLNAPKRKSYDNFYDLAISIYGKKIASYFLLDYSEKLWGANVLNLSPDIAGKRLKGLNLKTFLIEAIKGSKDKTSHLDGSFYYPDFGFGTITDKLAEKCGSNNIFLNKRITKIFHDNMRIKEIELNNTEIVKTDAVISSLPISLFVNLLDPLPEKKIFEAANALKFRQLILVVLYIDKSQISQNASLYFPEKEFPFTRIYEPKNRNKTMAPDGKTSLVVEIPCHKEDPHWKKKDEVLISEVTTILVENNFFREEEFISGEVRHLHNAYPILEKGYEHNVNVIKRYLSGFNNLNLAGRNGLFAYAHLHDLMDDAALLLSERMKE